MAGRCCCENRSFSQASRGEKPISLCKMMYVELHVKKIITYRIVNPCHKLPPTIFSVEITYKDTIALYCSLEETCISYLSAFRHILKWTCLFIKRTDGAMRLWLELCFDTVPVRHNLMHYLSASSEPKTCESFFASRTGAFASCTLKRSQ